MLVVFVCLLSVHYRHQIFRKHNKSSTEKKRFYFRISCGANCISPCNSHISLLCAVFFFFVVVLFVVIGARHEKAFWLRSIHLQSFVYTSYPLRYIVCDCSYSTHFSICLSELPSHSQNLPVVITTHSQSKKKKNQFCCCSYDFGSQIRISSEK